MTRPHERVGDALRTAREIVEAEWAGIARAARSGDRKVVEGACDRLARRIAEAILEADHEMIEQEAAQDEPVPQPHFATFVRANH